MTEAAATTDPAIIIPKESALAVLTDEKRFDQFYEKVKAEVSGHTPDLTSSAGRKAIAALAFKVTKTKTAIVAAADELTEDARKQVAKVNESKKRIEGQLNALRDEVRKPLTDWEEAEEARVAMVAERMDYWRSVGIVTAFDTLADVRARLADLQDADIDLSAFGDQTPIAQAVIGTSVTNLKAAVIRLEKSEAEAAELAALRRDKEERDQRDEEERRAREAEEQRQRDAQEEERRQEEQRAQEERERIAGEEEAERQRVAKEQQAERDRQAAEDRRKREAAEAETARLKKIEDDREAARLAEAKRARNRAHAAKVMGEAKAAIVALITASHIGPRADNELIADVAVGIVQAIRAGEIPHVEIKF